MKNTRERGLTFIEVIIVMAILAVVMVIVYMLVASATASAATQTTIQDLDAQCRQIMDEVTKDLRESDGVTASVVPSETTVVGQHVITTQISMMKVVTTDPFTGAKVYDGGGNVVWGSTLVPGEAANGLDDDRDGMIDNSTVNRAFGASPVLRTTTRGTGRAAITWPGVTTAPDVPRWPANQDPPAIYFAWVDTDGLGPLAPEPLVIVVVTLQGVDAKGRRLVRSLTTKVTIRNE